MANVVIALAYVLMALVRDQNVFMVVAALAGIGWTLSASELWVAGQRAMPPWARGRMNATVIMVSQGARYLGNGRDWVRHQSHLTWRSRCPDSQPDPGNSVIDKLHRHS